ncbi:MAG TPA: tail fiber domain-containing protein [Pyrinomonadaceae bacterium]|nr:tail fiber domain-containing protein [Pyrinomonadaceae bacterium]
MKNLKSPLIMLCMVLIVVCFHVSAWGQSEKIANVSSSGLSVRWDVSAPNAGLTLTVSAPDGQVFRKEFKGSPAEFRLVDNRGEKLPDGQYTYEIRLVPVLSADVKETLSKAREKGNDAEVARDLRKRGVLPVPLVDSGGFAILNGSAIVAGSLEEKSSRTIGKVTEQPRVSGANTTTSLFRRQRHHAFLNPMPDFVIADDLIVQGSACVGLDCIDGESFGFDTIRMKENNTRLQWDDTSVSAGFATNNWQLRANAQGSGGSSFLGVVDQGSTGNSETGTIIAQFDAGAPANSLRISSSGNLGVGTATPVLDVHANTSDTPAIRLEQNNGGGFTAQTWDIGANEANFFVRDVTSGSRLSLRIRPGAPTSSLDIAASGNVGIGTGSPASKLTVESTAADTVGETYLRVRNTVSSAGLLLDPNQAGDADWLLIGGFPNSGDFSVREFGVANYLTVKKTTGRVGIGTAAPDQLLSVNGDASKAAGGGSWQAFSDVRLKNIQGRFNRGLNAVMQLQPLRFEYKPNNALGLPSQRQQVGFSAQAVQAVIPEAVSTNDNGYMMVNNDPILWTMLNAIKEQQKEIEQLKTEVRRLKATARKRR